MTLQTSPLEPKQLLFICGAPRSGTTMICNLLDSHPDFLVFPLEHSTIEKFFWTQQNHRGQYFSTDFIANRKHGQQSILSSDEFLKEYETKIKSEFKQDLNIDIDPTAFLDHYLEQLQDNPDLENVLFSLATGLCKANEFSRSRYKSARYIVFKKPYYTEVFAQRLSDEIPQARFIHIMRNPLNRFASAKKRRIYGRKSGRIKGNRINFIDSLRGHAEISSSSYQMALKNSRRLGEESYYVLNYEDLADKKEVTMKGLFNWLNVEHIENLPQTRLGLPAFKNTSFRRENKHRSNGYDNFYAITNYPERYQLNYYLSQSNLSDYYDIKPKNKLPAMLYWFIPYKHEPLITYLLRLLNFRQAGPFFLKSILKKSMNDRLSAKALEGPVMISGAT